MLTHEQNKRIAEVGPGTPCGELLRRYWQPLCPVAELAADHPKKRVRILGEDLLVYRTPDGTLTCIEERCPHRSASLFFGFIEPDGIRCCYHGWKFATSGACLERPFEKTAPKTVRAKTYPLQNLGGLLFVYMGPQPAEAPPLPHWDVLVRTDRPRTIRVMPIHACNWLQAQENTVDSVHTYYLHGHMSVVYNLPTLAIGGYFYRPIQSYDWAISRWGIEKSLVYGGDKPEVEVRPPLIFPNILRIPEGPVEAMHFRVPVDDTRTRIIWVGLLPAGAGRIAPADATPFEYTTDPVGLDESYDLSTFYAQDRIVWETQGAIVDRSREILGASDRGIVMFRQMLEEQIQRVERGEAPDVAVVERDEAEEPIVFESMTQPWWEGAESASLAAVGQNG